MKRMVENPLTKHIPNCTRFQLATIWRYLAVHLCLTSKKYLNNRDFTINLDICSLLNAELKKALMVHNLSL